MHSLLSFYKYGKAESVCRSHLYPSPSSFLSVSLCRAGSRSACLGSSYVMELRLTQELCSRSTYTCLFPDSALSVCVCVCGYPDSATSFIFFLKSVKHRQERKTLSKPSGVMS